MHHTAPSSAELHAPSKPQQPHSPHMCPVTAPGPCPDSPIGDRQGIPPSGPWPRTLLQTCLLLLCAFCCPLVSRWPWLTLQLPVTHPLLECCPVASSGSIVDERRCCIQPGQIPLQCVLCIGSSKALVASCIEYGQNVDSTVNDSHRGKHVFIVSTL